MSEGNTLGMRLCFVLACTTTLKMYFKRRFLHIFCSESLLSVKGPTGMDFPPLQNFFSFLSLDINFFANFAVEKNNSHFLKPREIPCLMNLGPTKALINPPVCKDNFFTEKR